jgi:hypothetical protein
MNLSKEEKKFWQRHYRIEKSADIPQEMNAVLSIDSDLDDDYIFHVTSRVPIIRAFDLENTDITDEGIKLISKVKHVEKLELKDSRKITKDCLQYINHLKELTILNLMKTSITPDDVLVLKDLQNLKELYLSSDEDETYYSEKANQLKEVLPDCEIYINYELY